VFNHHSWNSFIYFFREHWRLLCLRCAAWRFKTHRADYYDYLSELIRATAGTKTLLNIFQDDAKRYSKSSVRGQLSANWAQRFPRVGGDLFSTWYGAFPLEDLVAIQAAQYAGAGALIQTLRQLSSVVKISDTARQAFLQTIFAGVASLFVALASLLLIPFFTAERLALAFASLPAEYFGPVTQSLFLTSDWLRQFWWLVLILILAFLWGVFWSMPNLIGPVRGLLDRWGIWRLYRVVQAVRFLSLLAVLLQPRGNVGARLKEALLIQQTGATVWMSRHIETMLERIDAGFEAVDALDTGLVEDQTWWYFTDMVRTLGLDIGLQRTCERLAAHTVNKLSRQAMFIRWALLLCSVFIVLGIAFWHVRVFEELRQGLSLYYAN
jgi:type II secretory pathway component PulF